MTKILLAIKPKYAEKILSGEKKFEFRKTRCKKDIDKIVIYATRPVMKVVGEAEVLEIIEKDVATLWELTKKQSGIDKKFYDSYFKNRDAAIAYKLGKITKYPIAKTLSDFKIKTPPQSFIYIS